MTSQEDGNDLRGCYENLIVIDVGANLTNKKYSRDLDGVVKRAKDSGVQKIMVTGTSVKSSKEALRLTHFYPGTIYSTAGVHPHDAKSMTEEELWQELREIASAPECVAVGECGLNYSKDFSEPGVQREVFTKQVEMACELSKPLIVHEKEAQDDILKILEGFENRLPPVVIHSFTGSVEQGQRYLEKGFFIGITGYLCKDKSDGGIRRLLSERILPLDKLLVETDSPFMYPNMRASKLPLHVKDSLTERQGANQSQPARRQGLVVIVLRGSISACRRLPSIVYRAWLIGLLQPSKFIEESQESGDTPVHLVRSYCTQELDL